MPTTAFSNRAETVISGIAAIDAETKLQALRELKNQIIGNRTKKLSYINLGAVPAVVHALSLSTGDQQDDPFLLIQSAAALGSFACGFDAGVKAVLDAGAFPHLFRLLSHPSVKVVDACARSLRIIYQSKLAPKYDFIAERNMEFIFSLLSGKNEIRSSLGMAILTHSCDTQKEQEALFDAGVAQKLINLLDSSFSLKEHALDSVTMLIMNNSKVISKFLKLESGKALRIIMDLMKDRYPLTRLYACKCLIAIENTSTCFVQDVGIKTKLILTLLDLLDDPSQAGDEASFVFSSLIAEKEGVQKIAFEVNAIDKILIHLEKRRSHAFRIQGLMLALADMCSKLECCRSKLLSLKALNFIIGYFSHESAEVRAAACTCLKYISRSLKNLSAGNFVDESKFHSLLCLLNDPSPLVQVEALGVICNTVVCFDSHKSIILRCRGVEQLALISKSIDSVLRANAVWALTNLIFLADKKCKDTVFMNLKSSCIASLICDPDPLVQEKSLGLVRNLVDCIETIEFAFLEDCMILNVVVSQLRGVSKTNILVQAMYVLSNIATGNEFHKDTILHQLMVNATTVVKLLQSDEDELRSATIWSLLNLTFPASPGASSRLSALQQTAIVARLKEMVDDPCLDVKVASQHTFSLKQIYHHILVILCSSVLGRSCGSFPHFRQPIAAARLLILAHEICDGDMI